MSDINWYYNKFVDATNMILKRLDAILDTLTQIEKHLKATYPPDKPDGTSNS